jgi:hypothetical protein
VKVVEAVLLSPTLLVTVTVKTKVPGLWPKKTALVWAVGLAMVAAGFEHVHE